MSNKQYFFDKRVLKRFFLRYGIVFLLGFATLIGLSFLLENIDATIRIIIYLAILVAFVVICEVINHEIVKRERLREEQRILAEKEAKKEKRKQQKQQKQNNNK